MAGGRRQSNMIKYFVLLFLFFPAVIFAAGIEVTPAKLTGSGEIVVVNPTPDVQVFEVYADDFAGMIEINPASFVLEANGSKNVTVSIKSEQRKGIRATNISVVGKPLAESRFTAGTGVKIPLVFQTEQSSSPVPRKLLWYLGGVTVGLALVLTSKFLIRRLS